MNMERVEELIDVMVDSARLNHQTSVDKWRRELEEIFKQQQQQIERFEKALKEIRNVGWSESFGGCHSFTGENHARCIDLAEKALDQ